MNPRIVFIAGTDTGVGKTVLTALLLRHLRQENVNVRVIKPFCSGGRQDAIQLAKVIGPSADLDAINPFHFKQPLTPLLAARAEGRRILIGECLSCLKTAARDCEVLLVEGAGGLLSPLGEGFDALDLIRKTKAETILVAPNRIGVLNHIFLNLSILKRANRLPRSVVLMNAKRPDASAPVNARMIRKKWAEIRVCEWPFLGDKPLSKALQITSVKKLKKTLAATMARP